LLRTPYGKPNADWSDAKLYCPAGYAMVVQDCRGRGRSEGVWDPFRYDPQDGFDTQEWVGKQPWCNGKIGTSGGSYLGWTQWASAPLGSRYLKTMVPVVPFGNAYDDLAYPGGAFQLALLFGWGVTVGGNPVGPQQLSQAYRQLPLQRWNERFPKKLSYLREWTEHPRNDDFWKARGIDNRYDLVKVPVLNIGGWYDIFSKTTIDLVDQVRDHSEDRLVRRNQFVVIGPWAHGVGVQKVGELDFGPAARLDVGQMQFKWFQYWLQGKETDVEDWPPYRLFVMGENVWRGENEWPLARTAFTKYFIHSGGKANSRSGDGVLSTAPPSAEPPDSSVYDPKNPVPTVGGNNLVGAAAGPLEQSKVEEREDVLVYTSEPLASPTEVTGPVKMVLFASTNAPDTDFTAKLVDVHPDGKAYNLCDGVLRARYRRSTRAAEFVESGKVYRYDIDLWVTSNLFKKGHRIRVEVSSSNFPRFDRNPNTGRPFGVDEELRPANQTVYHNGEHASHLVLPIIPRSCP
jgi:putative CocE/NonD family hydrolase